MASNRKRKRVPEKTLTRGSRISFGKKLLFAGVVNMLFFTATEGMLWLAGVRPLSRSEDAYIGFAGYHPLYVPERDVTSAGSLTLTTADNKLPWFNAQAFSKEKPRDTYRVFCLGGSTTYGRPYSDPTSFCGWMREFLNAGDSDTSFEVINAGGISYASYRVVRVLQEVLQHDADLVVIYTGHNEFLEDRTYKTLREQPTVVKWANATLSHTRTYSLIKTTLSPSSTNPVAAQDLLPAEVETRLDSGIGPDAFERDASLVQRVLEQFDFNIRRMVQMAGAAGCKIVLVAPASNLRHCSPFKSVVDPNLPPSKLAELLQHLADAESHLSNDDFLSALLLIDQVLVADRNCSAAHYLRGSALFGLGRYPEARDAFIAARDTDVCALRATSGLRQIVLEVAMALDVPLLDFQELAENKSDHQILGSDLFLDHVHPTIDGHRLLALDLVRLLVDRRLVPLQEKLPADVMAEVTARVNRRVDQKAHGDALRNLAKVFRWAGKETEANRMALRAETMLEGDPNALYLAANALLASGEVDAAIVKLQESLDIDSKHAPTWLSLGVAVQTKGDTDQAFQHFTRAIELDPDNLMALNNLASLHAQRNEWTLAIDYLQRAIEVNPRYAKAHHNLGVIYAKQSKWQDAINSLSESVAIDPNAFQPHLDLANLYRSRRDAAKTVQHLQRALQLNKELVLEANALAWVLATSRDGQVRNGKAALRWALYCAEKTDYKNPAVFNTLAAAHAEVGNYEEAIQWQTRALQAVPPALKATCETRLRDYQSGKPHRADL